MDVNEARLCWADRAERLPILRLRVRTAGRRCRRRRFRRWSSWRCCRRSRRIHVLRCRRSRALQSVPAPRPRRCVQRFGCRDTGDIRTQTHFLQAQRIELAARCQSIRGLKLLHGVDGTRVPLPIRRSLIIAAAGQRRLNLAYPVRSGSFLNGLMPGMMFFAGLFL